MTDISATPLTDADLDALRAGAGAACGFLRALAHEDRLLLLCQLSQGECSVQELEARVGLGQPSLSQQLGILRRQDLVASRAEGRRRLYRVADPRVLALLQTLHGLFCPNQENTE